MEHGKTALIRVVFSSFYADFYYRFFRGVQQPSAGGTYHHVVSGKEYTDDAYGVKKL